MAITPLSANSTPRSRGRPRKLPPAEIAESTSLTHADLRQARHHLNTIAHHLRAAYALLGASEARLVPVIQEADRAAFGDPRR